jgi:DNA invertase Pin-like site-specific DNA recombinase
LESRVIELGLLPLRSEEFDSLLHDGSPGEKSDEELLASFVALGLPATEIARRLHVSRRTAYRRIEKLRNSTTGKE